MGALGRKAGGRLWVCTWPPPAGPALPTLAPVGPVPSSARNMLMGVLAGAASRSGVPRTGRAVCEEVASPPPLSVSLAPFVASTAVFPRRVLLQLRLPMAPEAPGAPKQWQVRAVRAAQAVQGHRAAHVAAPRRLALPTLHQDLLLPAGVHAGGRVRDAPLLSPAPQATEGARVRACGVGLAQGGRRGGDRGGWAGVGPACSVRIFCNRSPLHVEAGR